MTNLLSCPFCGGEAKKYTGSDEDGERHGYVACLKCPVEVYGFSLIWYDPEELLSKSLDEAVEFWNRRV